MWRGPFLIQKRLNASNYVLWKLAGRKSFVAHTDRMRALSDDDSVDENAVNKSSAPKPSLLSPSTGRETDVEMTAVSQRLQSVEAAAAGDQHASVCVTSSTSGCTVAPPSESASINTHTNTDTSKTQGTDLSATIPPLPALSAHQPTQIGSRSRPNRHRRPPARYHDFVQRLQQSFARLTLLEVDASLGSVEVVAESCCSEVVGQTGLAQQQGAGSARTTRSKFTSPVEARYMSMAGRGEMNLGRKCQACQRPFRQPVLNKIWANAGRGSKPRNIRLYTSTVGFA